MERFKNLFKKTRVWILVIGLGSLSFVSTGFVDNYFEVSKNLDIFASLYKELNIYYVDETKPGDLMKKGIDSMLESLDPYTNYIPESEIEDYRFMTTGQYGGIGASIRKKGDYVVIADPYEGFAAQKNDLRAGDLILSVDGKSMKGKNTDDVTKLLKGSPGTTVKVSLQREGEKNPIEKSLTREEIKIDAVPYYGMLNSNTGYINLSSFTESASREVKAALLKLKENPNMSSLVLDLRGNPGGLLNEAVNIVNLFVEKDQEVVSTKGRVEEWKKTYKAVYSPVDVNIPIVVLVNSGSASASEIVAGALQDLDRAVVLGTRTFGKGLVQTTRPLSYNAKLKVTTAKYYIPSGRCIQAIDYAQRNEDGSVAKIPDSLMHPFKTKNGRTVLDGGGIKPDVTADNGQLSKLSVSLLNKMHIFDFATQYKNTHPTIASAENFRITDAEYDEFVKFLSGKEYDYITKSEKLLNDLKEAAEAEKYMESAKAEYEALKTKMIHDKKADLLKFKEELKDLLTAEISARYYFQKGRLKSTLAMDREVKKALDVLNQKEKYTAVLSGSYKDDTSMDNSKKN